MSNTLNNIYNNLNNIYQAKQEMAYVINDKLDVELPDKLDKWSDIIRDSINITTDVKFLDYDGKELYVYEKDEFLALTELPELPSQSGLVCQGWNWTLEDAKEYVQEYDKLNIGATYITDDNKTRLYIKLENDVMTIPLYINQSAENSVTVDWGDGSDSETVSGTGNVIFNHTYNEAGSYTITLTVNPGNCTLGHNDSSYNVMGAYNTTPPSSLYKVEIGSNMSISTYAFQYCYPLQSVTIPNSVTSIGDYAFYYCRSLKSLTIPNSVNSAGANTFQYCNSLQSVTIPNSVNSVGNYTFSGCTLLTSITIPNSVNSIDVYAFEKCYSLQSVTIPNSVNSIAAGAFRDCFSLQSVTIPNSVTSIESNTLQYCFSLQSVTIPNSVTSIAAGAFSSCYSIQYYDFTSYTSIPTLSNAYVFSGVKAGCEIRVPAALYNDWINATNWSNYADYIVPIGSNIKYFIFNVGGQYKKQYFEDGMTWGQWLNSSYNSSNKTISDIITPITESDLIIEKSVYDLLYGAYIVDLEGNLLDPNTFVGTADDVTGIGLVTDNVKMIVALDEWYSSSESTVWNGNQYSAWGGYNKTVTGCWFGTSGYLNDFDGEANTDVIIAQLKDITDSYSQYYTGAPAAEYCRAYSKGYKDVGSWYLPAAGELNEIVLNKDAINAILTKLGKNNLSKNSYTWSSSQYNSQRAWNYSWSDSNWRKAGKDYGYGVRPVCAF